MKKGKSGKFKIEDESGNPLSGVNLDVNIGGKKYVRKTNSNGEISVKMGKTGTYSAKIKSHRICDSINLKLCYFYFMQLSQMQG